MNSVAIIHAIVLILVVGYAQNYYFHLRTFIRAADPTIQLCC